MSKPVYLFSTSSHPDAISVNSLDINFSKPQVDFTQYDYFIITSKQVSKVLEFYKTKALKPALCISKATAKAYEKIGGEVLGIGKGYGDNLIIDIKKYPKDTRWLYLRAKVIASDFVKETKKENYFIDECVVYESECSQEIQGVQVEKNATLIFTSPSSVKCFLKYHTISEEANIIVIGKTTARALPKNTNYKISEKTTIQSCLDLVN